MKYFRLVYALSKKVRINKESKNSTVKKSVYILIAVSDFYFIDVYKLL